MKNNEKGQSLVEFILLMVVLASVSKIMLSGINGGLGEKWKKLVQVIAAPHPSRPLTLKLVGE